MIKEKVFPQKSPVAKKKGNKGLFDFPKAIEKIASNNKVSKKEWENTNVYGVLKDAKLVLHKSDGEYYPWIISEGDIYGKDWFVIKK